jgi:hypothetical protein
VIERCSLLDGVEILTGGDSLLVKTGHGESLAGGGKSSSCNGGKHAHSLSFRRTRTRSRAAAGLG